MYFAIFHVFLFLKYCIVFLFLFWQALIHSIWINDVKVMDNLVLGQLE